MGEPQCVTAPLWASNTTYPTCFSHSTSPGCHVAFHATHGEALPQRHAHTSMGGDALLNISQHTMIAIVRDTLSAKVPALACSAATAPEGGWRLTDPSARGPGASSRVGSARGRSQRRPAIGCAPGAGGGDERIIERHVAPREGVDGVAPGLCATMLAHARQLVI